MPHHDLLLKLKNGEELAYKSIFNDYYPLLVAFAHKYLIDIDLSKEITQTVFVKFYEKRQSIEITSSIKSYLYKMVYNDCLNHIKSKKIADQHYSNFAKETILHTDYDNFIEQTEEEHQIYNAIEKLPPQCKLILQQSRLEGKKNREIANELNISIRTVETQISKAIRLLKSGLRIFF